MNNRERIANQLAGKPMMWNAPDDRAKRWYRKPGYRPGAMFADMFTKFVGQPVTSLLSGDLHKAAGEYVPGRQGPKDDALVRKATDATGSVMAGSVFTKAPANALRASAARGKSDYWREPPRELGEPVYTQDGKLPPFTDVEYRHTAQQLGRPPGFDQGPQEAYSYLAMDHASRMQRARDMGFDTDTVWYHGSPDIRDINKSGAFDARRRTAENRGDPLEYNRLQEELDAERSANGTSNRYFELLNQVASLKTPVSVPQGVYFSDNKAVARSYMNEHRAWDYQNAESGMVDAYVRGNLLDISAGGSKFSNVDIASVRAQIPKDMQERFDDLIARYSDPTGRGKIRTGDLETVASELGFDGFRLRRVRDTYEGGGEPSTVVAIFDPSNIRSVNATFDPAKSSSANLLAANPFTGAVVPTAMEANRERLARELAERRAF